MYSESRKIHLIAEVLKVKSDAVLTQLETVLKSALLSQESKRVSAHDFLGTFSKKDASLMEKAIEEGCEQIHPDDWK